MLEPATPSLLLCGLIASRRTSAQSSRWPCSIRGRDGLARGGKCRKPLATEFVVSRPRREPRGGAWTGYAGSLK